jgi:cytidine deaminase
MVELLPYAFGPADLDRAAGGGEPASLLPERLHRWRGHGTVFVHPDVAGGERVWTAYWERSSGFTDDPAERGILEEGPIWPAARTAVEWGRARTTRVVVVDADGGLSWAGEGEPPPQVPGRWRDDEEA